MARPFKQTVDYFPHYVNHGKTLLILQNEYGNDGYAFWFKMLSLLCKTDGQVYDYNNPSAWRLLLAETHVSGDIAENILKLLSDINAIDPELHSSKIIWVQNLIDNLSEVYTRRRNGSMPSRPVIADNNPVNVNNNTQTKLNQTKLNQTKLNQTKQDITKVIKPTNKKQEKSLKQKFGEFLNVFLTPREHEKLITKFGKQKTESLIEQLSTGIASKGYKYKSHYAALLAWEKREPLNNGSQKGATQGRSGKYENQKYGDVIKR